MNFQFCNEILEVNNHNRIIYAMTANMLESKSIDGAEEEDADTYESVGFRMCRRV